ncbi:nucleotide exchange factor GrpE [Antrihabitans stalactiti]|uniref:Protein GrpE n=1 Tax=Antrihabitans stalactiti TaxID=2584121 RepID=A0A848KQC3_9NOCA|nr:nucleotide exchange factor GrpE [Antrihabitans stalactiti]
MSDEHYDEPVTIVDNRKIDPETGEIREPDTESAAEFSAAGAGPASEGVDVEHPAVQELAERTGDLQRLQAEYTNYRRRVERDKKATIEAAKASVVAELLAVVDDLERARSHGDLESGPMKAVAAKLIGLLEKQGVAEFGAEGEPFDPTLHEAVQHDGEGRDPVIGSVFRKGYRIGDRVLRHAMVTVTDQVSDAVAGSPTEVASSDTVQSSEIKTDADPEQR